MKVSLPFKSNNVETKQKQINIIESYNLWDILAAKYTALERLCILKTFAHDPDLKAIITMDVNDLKKDVRVLEIELEKHGIRGANNHIAEPATPLNNELYRDQFIAGELYLFLQENIEMLLRALRTTTTNDELQNLFTKLVKDAIDRADRTAEYLKLRGWIGVPPMYHNVPATNNEIIDNGEAFYLWNHLAYRYDNAYQTQLFSSFVFDTDFKVILQQGHKVLMKQVEMLEKEIRHFGLPMPIRPPTVKPPAENTEIMNDDFMYRTIITGMQGAMVFHAQGLKQAVTNKRVRTIFKDLLNSELSTYNKMIKFGKLKAWLNATPSYSTKTN